MLLAAKCGHQGSHHRPRLKVNRLDAVEILPKMLIRGFAKD